MHYLISELGAYAQIAQLVEQWTENPRVAGSIPALGTKNADTKMHPVSAPYGGVPERPKGADCKSVVARLRWFESIPLHHNFFEGSRTPPGGRLLLLYQVKRLLFGSSLFCFFTGFASKYVYACKKYA